MRPAEGANTARPRRANAAPSAATMRAAATSAISAPGKTARLCGARANHGREDAVLSI